MIGRMTAGLLLFAASAALAAADPFVLPKEALVLCRDSSGRSWALNGVIRKPLAAGRKLLEEALRGSGYRLRHEIPVDAEGRQHFLLSFGKGGENLILMLWSSPDGGECFFSYGIDRK